ncbi:MAG: hypothetical protein F4W89_00915 [Acidobacteria bacterium]|nr:hypothetical protein [Acidobacteriota bacterium]
MNERCRVRSAGRTFPRSTLFLIAGLAGLVAVSGAAQPDSPVERLVTETLGFAASDVQSLERGSAIIRSLDTPVAQELAHVGVVYLNASPEAYIEAFRAIEEFEHGPSILQIGRFSTPPRMEDLQALTLSSEDFIDLPKCRPGDCVMKLSAEAIESFRTEVTWSSPQAWRQADQVARTMLVDLVRTYQVMGNPALGTYFDHGPPLPVADQFRALLARRDALPASVPILFAYLEHYPRDLPPGADDFFYWSTVDFGLKPTIRVNHVTIYPLPERQSTGVAYAIAIKQIYASHYFHSALDLRFLIERLTASGQPGAALVSVARSRSDGMTGFRGSLLRPIVRRRSRDALRNYLEHIQDLFEVPSTGVSGR